MATLKWFWVNSAQVIVSFSNRLDVGERIRCSRERWYRVYGDPDNFKSAVGKPHAAPPTPPTTPAPDTGADKEEAAAVEDKVDEAAMKTAKSVAQATTKTEPVEHKWAPRSDADTGR